MDELTARGARESPFRASVTGRGTARPGAEVVADLAAVDFFGAAGIKALVGPAERARSRGGVLRVDPVSPVVARVLDLVGCRARLGCPPAAVRSASVARDAVVARADPLTAPGAGSPAPAG